MATTLTLAVREPGPLAGEVTLYGASRRAFDGHHGQLSEILGASPAGAVTNADLPFRALAEAEEAPERLRRASTLDEAGADRRAAPAARARGGAAADPRRGRPRRDQRGAAGRGRDPAAPSLAFRATGLGSGGAGGTARRLPGSPQCACLRRLGVIWAHICARSG